MFAPQLMDAIRDRFLHVDACPFSGPRIYFENAGGALTLKSVVDVTTQLAGIPDNQHRDNPASHELERIIEEARDNMRLFLGVESGPVFIGESGTELLFRMVRAAALGTAEGGNMIGSTLEHPSTASAGKRWAEVTGREYRTVVHDNDTGLVTAADYAGMTDANTRVATVIQTNPITGMSIDLEAVVRAIRDASPDCIVILDGIQHAAHGGLEVDSYDIDGYAVSAYKAFSRHNYGFAWVSPRLATLPHDQLAGTPADHWELGTRDTSAYACTTRVIEYMDWLGSHFTVNNDRRERLLAAGQAVSEHEHDLVELMINGNIDQQGLRNLPGIFIVGGADNPAREGLVSFIVEGVPCTDLVAELNARGIRLHTREADYYSRNVLDPLGQPTCVRASLCHYNTAEEVLRFLAETSNIIQTRS